MIARQTQEGGDERTAGGGVVVWGGDDALMPGTRLCSIAGDCAVLPTMGWYMRAAIDNDRAQGTVTYWYRDHMQQGKRRVETVSRTTFIGRMVQHILPKGFQRIRY
jgi:hypothetical protein